MNEITNIFKSQAPIPTFDQSDGTSASALLEGFLAAPRGVLLGVRGHWEDAEFAADDLGALIIVRLPFAVPSEPNPIPIRLPTSRRSLPMLAKSKASASPS